MTRYRFTPDRADFGELKSNFTGRDGIFAGLLDRIRDAGQSGSPNHCILVGPRGIGKSHILMCLYYTVRETGGGFAEKWVPVKFSEEEYYSITCLSDFFFKIVDYMRQETGEETFAQFADKMKNKPPETVVDSAVEALKNFEREKGKQILLLPENMHRIFAQLPERELERLRGIMIGQKPFMIVGSALSVFDQIIEHDEPFFNFFEIIQVSDLSPDDIVKLLLKRDEYEKNDILKDRMDEYGPKIRMISHLTGGNPRLALFLYELIVEQELTDVEKTLKRILEEQTPYYQAIMDGLATQQRKIVDNLAIADTPLTSTEIAAAARIDLNAVTSQIKRLDDLRIVRPVKLKKKRYTRYEVSDRFFRIWREWRTPAGKNRVTFLIDFLKIWYKKEELITFIDKAFGQISSCEDIGLKPEIEKLFRNISHYFCALPAEEKFEKLHNFVRASVKAGKTEAAISALDELKKEAEKSGDNNQKVMVHCCTSFLFSLRNEYDEALINIEKAIEIDDKYSVLWALKGFFCISFKRSKEAVECFDKAISLGYNTPDIWFNRGVALGNIEMFKQAIESFNKAIELGDNSCMALVLKTQALFELRKNDEAIENLKSISFENCKEVHEKACFVLLSLRASEANAAENNIGNAEIFLAQAMEAGKKIFDEKMKFHVRSVFVLYVKNLCKINRIDYAGIAIKRIVETFGDEMAELLFPYEMAVEYIKTGDVEILEKLQQEVREIVIEIADRVNMGSERIFQQSDQT